MVPPARLELATLSLEVSCSIQLSYGGTYGAGGESRTPVICLENKCNSRYTTPAIITIISYKTDMSRVIITSVTVPVAQWLERRSVAADTRVQFPSGTPKF